MPHMHDIGDRRSPRWKERLLAILFPPCCIHCKRYIELSGLPLCPQCAGRLTRHTALLCPICDARLAANARTCGHGAKAIEYPYLLGAVFDYADSTVRECIHAFKYDGMHAIAPSFSQMLAEYARSLDPQPSAFLRKPLVIPIPLHRRKERRRGFNQSALVARGFAVHMGFDYAEPLARIKHTSPQAQTKDRASRKEAISGAFAVADPSIIVGKDIVLVDDVSTSGATLAEAARTLKRHGARSIIALVIAKA